MLTISVFYPANTKMPNKKLNILVLEDLDMLMISVFYPANTKMPNKKLNILVLEDLDYADDIGLLSSKHQDAQQKAEHLSPRRSRLC